LKSELLAGRGPNDELGITLTPVRVGVGVEKTLAWLHAQRRI
jgi:hypothetical protein